MAVSNLKLGEYLEVDSTFGFGENGGLVVNEAAKKLNGRKLSGSVSKIVGYVVRNCAKDVENSLVPPVFEIPVRHWSEIKAGEYTPSETTIILNPGDTAIIEACDFLAYILNNQETHGLALKNGVIKRSTKARKTLGALKLDSYTPETASYFCFSFKTGCGKRVHDPEYKKSVGFKHDGVWKVKEEYKKHFGFLEVTGCQSRRVRKIVQVQIAERIRADYSLVEGKQAERNFV